MIYVTHDQIEAMTMADRIVIMDKGVIQQVGTPREVYNNPKNRFVAGFIGSPSMNFLEGEIRDGKSVTVAGNGFELELSPELASRAKKHNSKSVSTVEN